MNRLLRIIRFGWLLLLGLAGTAGASAVQPMHLEYVQGIELSRGTRDQLYPSAVTIEPVMNELCVTENRGRAFHILNAHGIEVFRTGRFADLRGPQSGCLDADGNVIYLDHVRSGRGMEIRKLNLFGEPVPFEAVRPSKAWYPVHLVIAPDGDLLTLDPSSGLLARHDPLSGRLLWQRLLFESQSGELGLGKPACTPNGSIFVPGGETHQVHVLSAEGEMQYSFGEFGTGPGRMIYPVGVAFGPEGTILVLDRMRHKILLFDSEIEYLADLGQAGIWPGQFYHPLAITASEDGRVFVSQGFQSRVQMFRLLRKEQG